MGSTTCRRALTRYVRSRQNRRRRRTSDAGSAAKARGRVHVKEASGKCAVSQFQQTATSLSSRAPSRAGRLVRECGG
jgi:hypothetical protein